MSNQACHTSESRYKAHVELRSALDARPLTSASVVLLTTRGEFFMGKTNEEGHFELILAAQSATLRVSVEGFCDRELQVVLDAGGSITRVRLMPCGPAVAVDRLSLETGQSLTVYYHAPKGGELWITPALMPEREQKIANLLAVTAETSHDVVADGVGPRGSDWPRLEVELPKLHSGLYIVSIRCDAHVSRAPLVIRPHQRTERLLAVCSVATWTCYNEWGGRNRYRNYENAHAKNFSPDKNRNQLPWYRRLLFNLITRHIDERRKELIKSFVGLGVTSDGSALSFDRPWSDSLGLAIPPEQPCMNHLAGLEIKILDWLINNGWCYDLVADIDLSGTTVDLGAYDAVVLLGHSEYWNQQMFESLYRAHTQRGTWVLSLSGNTIYREIGPLWPESRAVHVVRSVFANSGTDESTLTGTRYLDRLYGTAQPYRIVDGKHWVFKGLALPLDGIFGTSCLIRNGEQRKQHYSPDYPTTEDTKLIGEGACGWETDRRTAFGRKYFKLIAQSKGGEGGDIVVREPNGLAGGFFGVSSINFGGSLAIDVAAAGMVNNVLNAALKANTALHYSTQASGDDD